MAYRRSRRTTTRARTSRSGYRAAPRRRITRRRARGSSASRTARVVVQLVQPSPAAMDPTLLGLKAAPLPKVAKF